MIIIMTFKFIDRHKSEIVPKSAMNNDIRIDLVIYTDLKLLKKVLETSLRNYYH